MVNIREEESFFYHSGEKSLKKYHFSTFKKIELTIDELGALAFKWQR